MNKFAKIFQLMFEAPGNITGAVGAKEPMTAEDDLKFLREGSESETEDEETPTEEETTEEEETPEEETEEEEEIEEEEKSEEESEEENEEDDKTSTGLVTAKDLKAIDPKIFKKIPELRGVLYREQQYSQIFADPKEAQSAAKQAEAFNEMESDLVSGNSLPLFEALKKSDGIDFDKFASNILPSLRKVDENTFMKVIAVPLKQILRRAARAGSTGNNKNLEYAAQHIHQFIFDNTNLDEKADLEGNETSKKSPDEEKYAKKLDELDQRDHRNFKNTVDTEWLGGIETDFKKLTESDDLSPFMSKKIFEEAIFRLNKVMTEDTRHMKNLDSMWKNAKASGYNSDSKSRIVNTALARAKQILPGIVKELKKEALVKGEGPKKLVKKIIKPAHGVVRKETKPKTKSTAEMSDLDIIRS